MRYTKMDLKKKDDAGHWTGAKTQVTDCRPRSRWIVTTYYSGVTKCYHAALAAQHAHSALRLVANRWLPRGHRNTQAQDWVVIGKKILEILHGLIKPPSSHTISESPQFLAQQFAPTFQLLGIFFMAATLSFHLYTAFLFTKSDVKTLIPPVVRMPCLFLCFIIRPTRPYFTASDTFRCSRRSAIQSPSSLPRRSLVVGPHFAAWTRKSDASTRDRRGPPEPPRPPSSSGTHYCPPSTHATLDDGSSVSFGVCGIWSKDPSH